MDISSNAAAFTKTIGTTKPELTPEEFNMLQEELDALRADIEARMGQEDINHIENILLVKDRLELAGRLLIHFSLDPVSWSLGVMSLSLSHILENMEIGHNVIHGQYDFMNHPKLNSHDYEWDIVGTSKNWKRAHNFHHHAFTNIIGKDTDYGFGLFRFSDDVEWNPVHLLQPFIIPVSGLLFEYSIALYDLEIPRYLLPKSLQQEASRERMPVKQLSAELLEFMNKSNKLVFKEFIALPLLAGPFAAKVALGNAAARVIRNVWAFSVIYCGHLPEGNYTFSQEEAEAETKGQWYMRQILGSGNFEGGIWTHILSGHLSHQIEHHLYPDLPAWRYREMGPKVEAICEKYGIPYHKDKLSSQLKTVAVNVVKYAIPPTEKLPGWLQKNLAKLSKVQQEAQDKLDQPKKMLQSVAERQFPTTLPKVKKLTSAFKFASAA
ncbi:MAG: fatty acid desaturase family protein [Oleiphilus sp.]